MRKTMCWAAAAALFLAGGSALAEEPIDLTEGIGPAVGVGLICNTSEQAEHYVGLLAGGKAPGPAMNAVNAQAHNPRACAVAAIAFIPDATVGTKTVQGRLVQIVRINVVAGYNGAGWQRTAGMVQYAVMEQAGLEI